MIGKHAPPRDAEMLPKYTQLRSFSVNEWINLGRIRVCISRLVL